MSSNPYLKPSLTWGKESFLSIFLLFVFWLIISTPRNLNDLAQHIAVGLVLSVLVTWLVKKPLFTAEQIAGFHWRNLFRFLAYLFYLVSQIIVAGLDVARRVLRRKLLIQPQLVEFHTPLKNEMQLVINANSITLTPGTITVDVKLDADGSRFLVHCISDEAAKSIRQSRGFVNKILRIYGEEDGG
jgi:multicomponent Na+:H+ antiporter subunit E